MKIYHNPRCTKSRETLALIRDAGVEPDVIEYLKTPPTAEEIEQVLELLGLEPQAIMRKKEALYKELGLHERDLSRDEAIAVLAEHPRLIERPIVVEGNRAIIGRPPENVHELLPG